MKKNFQNKFMTGALVFGLGAFFSSTLVVAEEAEAPEATEEHDGETNAETHAEAQTDWVPFENTERTPTLEENGYYPCTDCHDDTQPPNPDERQLEDEHDNLELDHGDGKFWCLTCHDPDDRDHLHGLKDQPISFDKVHELCGQCHFQRQKDFYYGGHGKRMDNWKGERTLASCTECHNPHSPSIKPRKPFRAPKVRSGLELDRGDKHHVPMPWERHGAGHDDAGHH